MQTYLNKKINFIPISSYPDAKSHFNNDIKEISFDDVAVRAYFEANKPYEAYEDSWFSLIQGIRTNPRLFKNKVFFSDHPCNEDVLVVYNHMCSSYQELAELFRDLLVATLKKELIWKNAKLNHLPVLIKYGFKLYKNEDSWNSHSKFDDQTYPQHICLIDNLKTLSSKTLAQLRQQMRAVEKHYNDIKIIPYKKENHKLPCLDLVERSAFEISASNAVDLRAVLSANIIYLDYSPDNSYVVEHNKKIVAFIAFDIRNDIANFNCLVHDRNIKYLPSYAMMKTSELLSKEGARYLNLSGSENKSLDHWKKKFHPVTSIFRTHVVFNHFKE
ncbi:MAG: hypothetical protein KBD36_05865 [Alphaproteobacteria bacterium]|nr:hypothetical protein [Alphaproteobacteria bacterium]MBP9777347.1 hypothetical protein [Alphaproteobacteria bacterium]